MKHFHLLCGIKLSESIKWNENICPYTSNTQMNTEETKSNIPLTPTQMRGVTLNHVFFIVQK